MAKTSAVERNKKRERLTKQFKLRRESLKKTLYNRALDFEERVQASIKLAALPRNSSATRIRNRCLVSGRARGVYRKFKMSRIALREMGSMGLIPGLTKASW